MNVVAEMTLASLRAHGVLELPHYGRALALACDAEPPPFGAKAYGDIFRQVASNPEWLAVSLIANADREGDGAGRLWSLAACTHDSRISAQIQQHAIDESRHSRFYAAILDITFPGAVDEHLRSLLAALSPGYTQKTPLKPIDGSPFAHEVTFDDLIQMNIAEIRTRIHQLLQRPMLIAHCRSGFITQFLVRHTPKCPCFGGLAWPGTSYETASRPERRERLPLFLDSLAVDELNHVAYTARLIEQFAQQDHSDLVTQLMHERVRDFNDVTKEEFEKKAFEIL